MKRWILLVFLLMPFALGEDIQVFKGWAESGYNITANDGQNFFVVYSRDTNETVVDSGMSRDIIRPWIDECVDVGIYKVCQSEQRFERKGYVVPPNVAGTDLDFFMYLTITKPDTYLELERDFSIEEPYLHDSVDVKTNIIRVGTLDVDDIVYRDTYSSDYIISSVRGCQQVGHSIVWKGDFDNENDHDCWYTVRPIRTNKMTNNVTLSYVIDGKNYSDTYKRVFDVGQRPIQVIINHTREQKIGYLSDINITLEAHRYIKSSLILDYPYHFRFDNITGFRQGPDRLLRDQSLQEGNVFHFNFKVNTTKVGLHQANLTVTYRYNDRPFKLTFDIPINYTEDDFVIYLDREDETIVTLMNPTRTGFRDVVVTIDGHSKELERLGWGRQELTFPLLSNGTHNLSVVYRTEYGQYLRKDMVLSYGQSSRDVASPEVELEDAPTAPPVVQERSFDMTPFLYIGAAIGGGLILLFIVFLIKSKASSGIDKDIARLREMNEEEATEEEVDEIEEEIEAKEDPGDEELEEEVEELEDDGIQMLSG